MEKDRVRFEFHCMAALAELARENMQGRELRTG
jgi:hypothetical protein